MAKSNITEDGNGINHQQREVLKQRYQKLRLLSEAMTEIYENPHFEDNYPGLIFRNFKKHFLKLDCSLTIKP